MMSHKEINEFREKIHILIDRLYDIRKLAEHDDNLKNEGHWIELEYQAMLDVIGALYSPEVMGSISSPRRVVQELVKLAKGSRRVGNTEWHVKADQHLVDFIVDAAERSGIGRTLSVARLTPDDLAELLEVPDLIAALDRA